MRPFAGIATAAILIAACGPAATTATPTPTPTPTPNPNTFKAELKASNEVPPITDAEASCSGTATVTFTNPNIPPPLIAKFDVAITGCPAGTAIDIGHIHEQVAGQNGIVKIDSTLKPGEITLTGGAVTFSRTNPRVDYAVIMAIMANPAGFYVNFHSTAHPGGVIRGQLAKA
jgi:CHRD domain-containing protein